MVCVCDKIDNFDQSQILCEGSAEKKKILFNFVLICWQSDKHQEILSQSCEDLFILSELRIVIIRLIIIIFNTEVNGALQYIYILDF